MPHAHPSLPRRYAGVLAAAIAIGLAFPAAADDAGDAPIVLPEKGLTVRGFFAGKNGKAAQDLSGIACRPAAADGTFDCLVVNDESVAAQRVAVDRDGLTPGAIVPLLGAVAPTAVGAPPHVDCAGKDAKEPFRELDGEGVAFAPGAAGTGGAFYVVGSHGCARHDDEFAAGRYLLARVPVAADGTFGAPALSWRVSEALDRAPSRIRDKIGEVLDDEGLNIEGIAAIGGRLLLGLRAPSRHKKAFVVSVPAGELFAPGEGEAVGKPVIHELPLGKNAGIRDLATLPDGKLLVLSGPTLDQRSVPYALSVYDPVSGEHRWLARLADVPAGDERAKAEAAVVLRHDAGTLSVLVLFDGIQNGGPQEYRLRY